LTIATRRTTRAASVRASKAAATTAPAGTSKGGRGRRRRSRHIGWHHNDRASRPDAKTFAAQFLLIAEGQVDYTPFTAAHRIEVERDMGALHLFGGRESAHAQFFNAKQAVIISIEGDQRVVFGGQTQRFHGKMFERQQEFSSIAQQKIHIFAREFDRYFWVLNLGVRILGGPKLVSEFKTTVLQDGRQELV
jgi:hypothetical protein